jgi:formate hydrogenlyase transcriptional activator
LDATTVTQSPYEPREDVSLERIVAEASSALIGSGADEIADAVEGVLQRLVETLDVDRGTFIGSFAGSDVIEAAYSRTRRAIDAKNADTGAGRVKATPQELPVGGTVVVQGGPGAETLFTQAAWAARSGITIPVAGADRRRYALFLEKFRGLPTWPDRTMGRLRLLTEIVAAAVYRAQEHLANRAIRTGSVTQTARRDRIVEDLLESSKPGDDFIVGRSFLLRTALERAHRVATTNATVLLRGETGTGKELFARAIHAQSARSGYPLVSVNCVALPPSLIESELFGHERGAFTGAFATRQGRFELAHRGTLFLDEIGDLPLDLQGKLLRVLQERTFERLGASRTQKVDVRIVAATNRDLETEIARRQFREDLYYRLSVMQIRVPALRDRPEDIPSLVWAIIRRRERTLSRSIKSVPQQVMDALQGYLWPGNVRELENVIERALINSSGDILTLLDDDFEAIVQPQAGDATELSSIERTHIQAILRECSWRINGTGNAAERLGLHPNTLRFRMKKLGIVRADVTRMSAGSSHGTSRALLGPESDPPKLRLGDA